MAASEAEKQVLIIEDHSYFADLLEVQLKDKFGFKVLAKLATAKEAYEFVEQQHLKLYAVFVDLRLGEEPENEHEGLELAIDIKSRYPQKKVIILSMSQDGALIDKAFARSIDAYLLKGDAAAEMEKAIKFIAEGKRYYGPRLREFQDIYIRAKNIRSEEVVNPTPTEVKVLKCLAQGMNSKEISVKLGNKETTVDVHRRNLMSKFGVRNVAQLIAEAHKRGFLP